MADSNSGRPTTGRTEKRNVRLKLSHLEASVTPRQLTFVNFRRWCVWCPLPPADIAACCLFRNNFAVHHLSVLSNKALSFAEIIKVAEDTK